MVRFQVIALCGVLALGCSSDRGFRPWEDPGGEDDPGDGSGSHDDDDDDGPGTGGWGDWELGEIPDLAIAVATYTEDGKRGGTEVVIADLRGQILDSWSPPIDPYLGYYPQIYQVRALGPGKIMVSTHAGWLHDTFDKSDNRDSGFEQTGSSEGDWDLGGRELTSDWRGMIAFGDIWIGDLTERSWTRVLHTDWETGRLVVDGTGQRLPSELWMGGWNLQAVPYGHDTDRLLLTWFDGACQVDRGQRALAVPLTPTAQGRLWQVDQAWQSQDEPTLYRVQGGANADGDAVIAAIVGGDPCVDTTAAEPPNTLVRWRLDGREEVLTDDLHGNDTFAFDPRTGAALVVSQPTADRGWSLRWFDAPGGVDLTTDHQGWLWPVAALDGEHGAALLVMQDAGGDSDLVLIAGGRDVWEIEQFKQGLGRREVQFLDGAVVAVPQ